MSREQRALDMDPQPNRPDAYQHWMDDAAHMGLMLYRMRQDSKRERLLREAHHHHHNPQRSTPLPAAPKVDPTPRTSAALQTPTVATRSTEPVLPPHPLYLPLD